MLCRFSADKLKQGRDQSDCGYLLLAIGLDYRFIGNKIGLLRIACRFFGSVELLRISSEPC